MDNYQQERERIHDKIHDFCRGDIMAGKGCLSCPLNRINVCNDGAYKVCVPFERLVEAEKVVDRVRFAYSLNEHFRRGDSNG